MPSAAWRVVALRPVHRWEAAGRAVVSLALAIGALGCSDDGDATVAGDADTTTTRPVRRTTTTRRPAATTTAAPTTTAPPVASTLAPVVAGERPRAAFDPLAVAEQINHAERAIRDPAATPEVVDAAGRVAQLAYRRVADHPEWDDAVLAALDPDLVTPAGRIIIARREFRAMHTRLSDTLPAWRIVEPLPAEQLLEFYQEAETTFGVPWHVLAAINLLETGMGRIQGLSVAGAQGPMQFLPSTWEAYGMGGDVNDPHDAILGAANYLAANGGADGTEEGLDHALFRYNNAQHYVRGVRRIAEVLQAEPVTLRAFHAWEVVYLTVVGDVVLEPGYEATERIPVADYLATHPDALV